MAEDQYTANYALTKPVELDQDDYHRAMDRLDARLVGRGPITDRPSDMSGDALWFVTDGDSETPDDTLTRWDPDAAEWVTHSPDLGDTLGSSDDPFTEVHANTLFGDVDGTTVDVDDVLSSYVYATTVDTDQVDTTDVTATGTVDGGTVEGDEIYDAGTRAMRADGWEIVLNDETPTTDKYLRFVEATDTSKYGATITRTGDNRETGGQSGWNGIAVEPATEIAGFKMVVSSLTTELERIGIQTHQQGGTDWIELKSLSSKAGPGDEVEIEITDSADYLQAGNQYDVLMDNAGDGYSRGSYEDTNQYNYTSSDFDVFAGMYSAGGSTQSDWYNFNEITAITDP